MTCRKEGGFLVGRGSRRRPSRKGAGHADYGEVTPDEYRALVGSTRGVHWVKYGNDKMELSAQLNCTEKAPKVECNRVKESEWAPPKPRSPAPKVKPGTVPPPRRTLGQKLKDLAFGGSKK